MTSPEPAGGAAAAARAAVRARFRRSTEVPTAFFDANGAAIARACRDLARVFARGGRLYAVGAGAAWSDALHVSVEFVHPVIVGKRALPAIALPPDAAQLLTLAVPGDAVIGMTAAADGTLRDTLAAARAAGLLTLALTGPTRAEWPADHHFAVDDDDVFVVQETQETCYHVLWELVHVFLDHPASLAADADAAPAAPGAARVPDASPAARPGASPVAPSDPTRAACAPDPVTHRCTACADEGLEARVVALLEDGYARVALAGGERADIALDLVGDVGVGDRVLIHAGVALVRLEDA